MSDGELTGLLFETVAEPNLIQPTMIYDFPTDISPLAKCRPDDPSLVERFEVFVAGMELGNAFSELNDPDEQERRLLRQVSQGGEEVPREVDFDYVRALAHGLPPTAGMGIGIDRLTMLLTDSRSIREVILFPLLRPGSGCSSLRVGVDGVRSGTARAPSHEIRLAGCAPLLAVAQPAWRAANGDGAGGGGRSRGRGHAGDCAGDERRVSPHAARPAARSYLAREAGPPGR